MQSEVQQKQGQRAEEELIPLVVDPKFTETDSQADKQKTMMMGKNSPHSQTLLAGACFCLASGGMVR